MDGRAGCGPLDERHDDRYEVQISDPGELAEAVPHLLGFRPTESLVLIALGGASGGRVGLTARADLPPEGCAGALVGHLVASIARGLPQAVVAVIVSEAPDVVGDLPHRELVHEVLLALSAHDLPLRDALLVRGGRWWSFECPYPCCAPGAGTPLPGGVSELAAASVATGRVVEPDRNALAARVAREDGPAAAAMERACRRAAAEVVTRAAEEGAGRLAAETWTAILEEVQRRADGARARERIGDGELARILCGLRDPAVRDLALGLAIGAEPAAAEALWTECTRRAPAPLDAAPATLLAVCAWLRGDGALANIALERALAGDPGYRLAGLLAAALAACVPPEDIRALVAGTVAELTAPRPAG